MTQTAAIIYYDEMASPIGPLLLATTERGLCTVEFGGYEERREKLERFADRWIGEHRIERNEKALSSIREQLEQYFQGSRRNFEVEYDLYGTEFQKRVWHALTGISYGATVSYKDIAQAIGSPKAVRAVGGANNRNPISIIIPCHRVIGASGEMVGYGGGLDIKSALLKLEGWALS
ncbi:methylated-DNA--[protein]-cysteine S-methyltransferase [Paenibacillus eucommiae]|uniref:Methylated-DNA--protein-cysteine methyltransferase n=1 Tax=Paenibacillus eucommiae TaxID=1355755 RepID=A0ABS4IZT0_9BACL|nr:methylated-DNA--[protein]-cysteine S-methyltransferase [Paenibacillus eucommiae]MBP1992351.1 O-6-methylguanine DNA methyltransferase [Paenibacillus eucommiae]